MIGTPLLLALACLCQAPAPAPAKIPEAGTEAAEETPAPDPFSWTGQALQSSAERALRLLESAEAEWPSAPRQSAKDTLATAYAPILLEHMARAKNPKMRLRALEGWLLSKSQDAVTLFLDALTDPDARVRAYAAKGLAALAEEYQGVAALLHEYALATLTGKRPKARAGITLALPTLRDALQDAMLETLQSPEETAAYRAAAAFSLGRMNALEAVTPLAKAAWNSDRRLAQAGAHALHALHAPKATQAWITLLGHPDPRTRQLAVESLGILGGKRAATALTAAARGEGNTRIELAQQATRALTRWPNSEAVPMLITVLEGPPPVQRTAYAILQRKTHEDLGPGIKEWQTWWQEYGRFGRNTAAAAKNAAQKAKPLFEVGKWEEQ